MHEPQEIIYISLLLTGGAEKCRRVYTTGVEGARKALRAAGRPTTVALEEARTAAIRKAENIFKLTKLSVCGKKQTREAAKEREYPRAQK